MDSSKAMALAIQNAEDVTSYDEWLESYALHMSMCDSCSDPKLVRCDDGKRLCDNVETAYKKHKQEKAVLAAAEKYRTGAE